jgi:hypothetical protein
LLLHNPTAAKARCAGIRALYATPGFAAFNAERMRRNNADPAFRKASLEGLRKLFASPVYREQMRRRRYEKLHAKGVPVGAEDLYYFARYKKFSEAEAIELCARAVAR